MINSLWYYNLIILLGSKCSCSVLGYFEQPLIWTLIEDLVYWVLVVVPHCYWLCLHTIRALVSSSHISWVLCLSLVLFAKTAKNAGDYYFVSLHTAANNSDPLFSAIWPYFTWLYALGHYNMFKTISKKEYKLQVYFGIGTSTTTTTNASYLKYLGWGTIQNVNNP